MKIFDELKIQCGPIDLKFLCLVATLFIFKNPIEN
jgi:hypothetical protein